MDHTRLPAGRQAARDSGTADRREGAASGISEATGRDLLAMLDSAADLLGRQARRIDAINIFPVPDGDTGTNMHLTVRSALARANLAAARIERSGSPADAAAVAAALARGALEGARGNSGIILSQLFRALALSADGKACLGAVELRDAFIRAASLAREGISRPVEGTILTVLTDVSVALASFAVGESTGLTELLEETLRVAFESVARTPALLPALRDAGVVDAGAHGLYTILDGLCRAVRAEIAAGSEDATPWSHGASVRPGRAFASPREPYGSCVELLVQAEGVELSSVRAAAERLGESLVVVGDGRQVRVHVHTEHPDAVLEAARGWGALCTLTIQDMDEEVARVGASGNRVAVIAVLADCGFAEILRGLGARVIYCDEGAGGDLLAQAAGESPGGGAIIVPTDSRTLALARAAASRRAGDTRVHVVATGTLPQAVAALIAVELDVAAAENARRMGEAAEPVRTIEVRRAPPPSEPAFLGWLDGEPEGGSANPEGVLESLLGRIGREAARLVTVYHRGGEDRGDEDRGDEDRGGEDRGGRLAELIGRRLPGVAIEIVVVPRMSAEFLVSVE